MSTPEPPARPVWENEIADFYAWERRGRGWWIWPHPVELEPPFRPYWPSASAMAATPVDDARKPTVLSRFAEFLIKHSEVEAAEGATDVAEGLEETRPGPDLDKPDIVELAVSLPPDLDVASDVAAQMVASLPSQVPLLGFELVGRGRSVGVQWTTRGAHTQALERQLIAHFPEIGLQETPTPLENSWVEGPSGETLVVDFGLSNEFFFSITPPRSLRADPLVGIVAALEGLREGDIGVFQVLFCRARHPWAESVQRAAEMFEDRSWRSLARDKVSTPLFAALLRVGIKCEEAGRPMQILSAVAGALGVFSSPGSNELIPLSNADYPDREHEKDLLERRTRRSGMLLNLRELVSLVHLPSVSVRSERLERERRTTREAPEIAHNEGIVLGENIHRGHVSVVHLPETHRLRHVHILGATGTGKSHLLLNLIQQDIEGGRGVGVLDPHGDLVDRILERIPEERSEDVVLLDPGDDAFPIAFNILSAHSELERGLLASDLVAIFRRLATSWGDQMTSVLRNAVLAFLESEEGGTLSDLRRFLVEPGLRSRFLRTVTDQEVVYFWEKEFPLLSGRPQGPLLTRLDSFLAPKPLRLIVSQKQSRLDFAEIMDQGYIFLARLSQGAIGEENAHLLGSLIAAKFQQLTAARQARSESERRPFFLYVDEFQHFATPSMAQILGGARKYGVGLVLAHQDLAQLAEGGSGLESAVLANPATRICFRVGDSDARKLAEGFGSFGVQDLTSLGRGKAICRIERSNWDFNLTTYPLIPVAPDEARRRRSEAVTRSQARYGTAREVLQEQVTSAASAAEPSASPAAAEDRAARAPKSPRRRGRGGNQHRYLQELLAKFARERGFTVTLEKTVLAGHGHVDLVLERHGVLVGCEVSVSTGSRHELGNLTKCLAAGLDYAVLVSASERTLRNTARRFVTELSPEERTRVHFLTPEAFAPWLDGVQAEAYARSRERADVERTKRGGRRGVGSTRATKPRSQLPPNGTKEMLDTQEAARYVRRAPQTLAKLRSVGGGPAYFKLGRSVYYDRADLDAWLDSRKRRSTSQMDGDAS